jgi:cytochrome c-type biogenesis protein CcmH/NrfG
MKTLIMFMLAILVSGASFAADTTPPSPAVVDTEMKAAREQIAKKDWTAAVKTLEPYTKANPKSADGFNLLGFSYRNLKRYDESLVAYKEALRLDPKHKGAHEYIGLAYIQMRQPAKAGEHLAVLDKLCTFTCEEYRELKKALEAYK